MSGGDRRAAVQAGVQGVSDPTVCSAKGAAKDGLSAAVPLLSIRGTAEPRRARAGRPPRQTVFSVGRWTPREARTDLADFFSPDDDFFLSPFFFSSTGFPSALSASWRLPQQPIPAATVCPGSPGGRSPCAARHQRAEDVRTPRGDAEKFIIILLPSRALPGGGGRRGRHEGRGRMDRMSVLSPPSIGACTGSWRSGRRSTSAHRQSGSGSGSNAQGCARTWDTGQPRIALVSLSPTQRDTVGRWRPLHREEKARLRLARWPRANQRKAYLGRVRRRRVAPRLLSAHHVVDLLARQRDAVRLAGKNACLVGTRLAPQVVVALGVGKDKQQVAARNAKLHGRATNCAYVAHLHTKYAQWCDGKIVARSKTAVGHSLWTPPHTTPPMPQPPHTAPSPCTQCLTGAAVG